MQTNIEQVVTMIRALPLEDFGKLREVIDLEEQTKRQNEEKPDWRMERYKKARKWLDENGERYLNKWVCLEGDELIAVDDDGRKVYQKAVEAGIKSPFIHYIEKEPEAYWEGWL